MLEMRTSEQWTAHFRANGGEREIPWESAAELSPADRKRILRSLQEFQLGESGEGTHIFRQAKAWAAKSGDTEYLQALRLFIAEEIRHSKELGAFMRLAGIAEVRHTWLDGIFRWTRKRAGLELTIAVLVAAEIIAKIYYAGLRDATCNPTLHHICELILRDEVEHVHFQCQRLAILRRGKSRLSLWWRRMAYHAFFAATITAVWLGKHGPVMRAGGWNWRRYRRGCMAELRDAMKIADPGNYVKRKVEGSEASRLAAGT